MVPIETSIYPYFVPPESTLEESTTNDDLLVSRGEDASF
jgi:hypothetical protein